MKKILIANRGEIAVRVIRTCRELGIETVAVFSDADRTSPHVLLASEAYAIGPAPSGESYLRQDKIVDVAQACGADAIHPGYGFLSENTNFAKAVVDAGMTWIGPPPEAVAIMGDKVSARAIAMEAGASVVPGSAEPVAGEKRSAEIATEIGYPILMKAVGGGGGKGMRVVASEKELKSALKTAQSEADAAFADDRVFIEKYLLGPRHIEIQIVADNHGNVVALQERECSVQRRYQKIIEESPSPFISMEQWLQMANYAKQIAENCGYVSAGTIEFLVDENHTVYFLEMNTRLQVEHPVTEMISGIDLVREQIAIAQGDQLTLSEESEVNGHAIECRIYAEDGFNRFVPSIGTVAGFDVPDGPGVRFDHGIRLGQEITPHYDPLLGKLIAWDKNRTGAIERMKRALSECRIVGIDTTIPFCHAVLSHTSFARGDYNTNFIIDEMESLRKISAENVATYRHPASYLTAIHSSQEMSAPSANGEVPAPQSSWKREGRKDSLR